MNRSIRPLVGIIFVMLFLISCSGTGGITAPDNPSSASKEPLIDSSRQLWGIWEFYVDESGISVNEVSIRDIEAHINVKKFVTPPFCSDCLKLSNFNHDTVNKKISVDVTLKNPTQFAGADVRGIFMPGQTTLIMLNPDDYTELFDDAPPDKNPFRLFGKTFVNGVFGPLQIDTEHYEIQYEALPLSFKTAIDAVYPITADREPYAISNQSIDGDLDTSGNILRNISVEVFDRKNNTGEVRIQNEDLGIDLLLTKKDGSNTEYLGTYSNAAGAPAGEYRCLISATDNVAPEILYDYLVITVSETVGGWNTTLYDHPGACGRDITATFNLNSGESAVFYPGGTGCEYIKTADPDFTGEKNFFLLVDIDRIVDNFSPNPIKAIDSTLLGGTGFFSSSSADYSDEFYTGPVESLLVTLFLDSAGKPKYKNPGDGDCGRIPPTNSALVGWDVTNDISGNLYGAWVDQDGVVPHEFYGLAPDYTRHDVIMGGPLPANLVGDADGKITTDMSKLKGLAVFSAFVDSGNIYVLESSGSSSNIEVLQFIVDPEELTTTYQSIATIKLGSVDAKDIEILPYNEEYLPNSDSESILVFIAGASGGYIQVYDIFDNALIETIGSGSAPILDGTPAHLDVNNETWLIYLDNDSDGAAVLNWIL